VSEIGKVSFNEPFDIRSVQTPLSNRAPRREDFISDQQTQNQAAYQQQQQQAEKDGEQFNELMETLREQQADDELAQHNIKRYQQLRSRNQQASEAYMRELESFQEAQTAKSKQELEMRFTDNRAYTERLQQIGKDHISKIFKQKSDDKVFDDLEKIVDPEAAARKQSERFERGRLRPEINRMLEGRKELAKEASKGEIAKSSVDEGPTTAEKTENAGNRSLLDSAVRKLQARLGKSGLTQQPVDAPLLPVLQDGSGPPQTPVPTKGRDAATIHPDLDHVQDALKRTQARQQPGSEERYIPLTDAEIEKELFQHKVPAHYGTIQAIRLASQRLQDSSPRFLKAAVLMAAVGLPMDLKILNTLMDTLRTYEQYPRASVLVKLYRYLVRRVQIHQNDNRPILATPVEITPDDPGLKQIPTVASSPLKKPGAAVPHAGMPTSQAPAGAPLFQSVGRDQLRILSEAEIAEAYAEDLMTPEEMLESEMSNVLRRYGLPASRIMVQQLLKNAGADPLRAQAMALQLAGKMALNPKETVVLAQKLAGMTPEEREAPFADVMAKVYPGRTFADVKPLVNSGTANKGPQPVAVPEQGDAATGDTGRVGMHTTQGAAGTGKQPGVPASLLDQRGAVPQHEGALLGKEGVGPPLPMGKPQGPVAGDGEPAFVPPRPVTPDPQVSQALQQMATGPNLPPGLRIRPAPVVANPSEAAFKAFGLPPQWGDKQPLAREAILLLHLLGERQDSLQQLTQPLRSQLADAPQDTLRNLGRMVPFLKQLEPLTGKPLPAEGKAALLQVVTGQLRMGPVQAPFDRLVAQLQGLQAAPSAPPAAAATSSLPLANRTLGLLDRFYGQASPAGRAALQDFLANAPAEARQGFTRLHQLLSTFDAAPPANWEHLWQQPTTQLYPLLSKLPGLLDPVLAHLDLNPYKQLMLPMTTQNRVIQAMGHLLASGSPDSLKSALHQVLQEVPATRDPLRVVQDRLRHFGVDRDDGVLMQHLYQLSGGSRDRLDALAVLTRGGLPLLRQNIQLVQQYLQNIPPQLRFQSVSHILSHLSPKLIQLLDRHIQSGLMPAAPTLGDEPAILPMLQQLFGQPLPPLPATLERLRSLIGGGTPSLLELEGELEPLLQQLSEVENTPETQLMRSYLTQLRAQMASLRDLLALPAQQLTPALLADLRPRIQQLLAQMRQSFEALEAQVGAEGDPDQSWVSRLCPCLQRLMGRMAPVAASSASLQTLLGSFVARLMPWAEGLQGLAQALRQPPVVAGATNLSPGLETPEETLGLLDQLTRLPQDEQELYHYLQRLGIAVPDAQQLGTILQLSEGSRDRLDAIGLLLKADLPLVPAHIQVIAQYVKDLPPQERFRSISQILVFLSDALIRQIQRELKGKDSPRLQDTKGLFGKRGMSLDSEAEQRAQMLLGEVEEPLSEQTLEATRYLLQSPLPKQAKPLGQIQHMLNADLNPRLFLQPGQEPLQRLLYVVQHGGLDSVLMQAAEAWLVQALQHIKGLQQLLSPQANVLATWLAGLSQRLQDEEEQYQAALPELEAALAEAGVVLPTAQGLARLQKTAQALCQAMQQYPELAAELAGLPQEIERNLGGLQQQLDNLGLLVPVAAHTESLPTPVQQLLLPLFVQGLNYPVEVSVQERTPESGGGEKSTAINLSVKTHTLGNVLFTLVLTQKRLRVRLGVENRTLHGWMQPYLEALSRKLEGLSFEIEPVQCYIVPTEQQGPNLIARQIRTRYRRSAIDAL
jgi:hypothetical protein